MILLLSLAALATAQDKAAVRESALVGRYQLIAAKDPHDFNTVFRIDTMTGRVSVYETGRNSNYGYYAYMSEIDEFNEWKQWMQIATNRGIRLPGSR